MSDRPAEVDEELQNRRAELADLKASLPAHSIRPHQLIEIEELEEEIDRLEIELERLRRQSSEG